MRVFSSSDQELFRTFISAIFYNDYKGDKKAADERATGYYDWYTEEQIFRYSLNS